MSDNQIKYEDVEVDEQATLGEEFEVDEPDVPMEDSEKEAEAGRLIRDAVDYAQSELAPNRQQATDYYFGRPFGDEDEGRSQVVSTDVKDTVDGMMPSVMRTLFGPTKVVEFQPNYAEDAEIAKMATDYVNYVIMQDNNGVIEIHNAIKDAMIRRTGVVKWWWDDTTHKENHEFTDLTEDQLILLEADENCEYVVIAEKEYLDPRILTAYAEAQQMYNQALASGQAEQMQPPVPPQAVRLFDVEVTYTNPDGRVRFAAVPPEEFLYSSDARNIEEAIMVGHRKDMRVSDLRAMGIPDDILSEIGTQASNSNAGPRGATTEIRSSLEAISRQPNSSLTAPDTTHDENMLVPFYEIYVYMDVDGDGVTEHRKMTLAGHTPKLIWDEAFAERPFAIFEVDPEPHTMTGMSVADRTMDLQLTKSKILRGSLDSLAFSIHPRTVGVEGEVSMADLMNTEVGAVIRERQPGMVRALEHEFVGQYSLPFLQYFDEMRETRTGQSKAAAGLDPDALQSSTQSAVAATVTGAAQRLELYTRMLVETGMKQLMRGILRTLIANQQYARKVRLGNQYTQVDPRAWDANMDVTVNVAVGYTVEEQRIAALTATLSEQMNILSTMGPSNPFVTFGQISQTLTELQKLRGYKDSQRFFNEYPAEYQPELPPPEPSPEEVLAKAQADKVQSDAMLAQAELELKQMEVAAREQRERERIAGEFWLKAKELELKYSTKLNEVEWKAAMSTRKDSKSE